MVLFYAFLSCASALPPSVEARPAVPRLLGRTYLRHTVVTPSPALPRAVIPEENTFIGRAERFQAIQRRHGAQAADGKREAALDIRAAPRLHTYPAEEEPEQVQ
ncbi:hypothetical protein C0989_009354 [Termitomyces sp. Mn162]|nr:hypothetical protein C0989_009354 [Termitomyces sp. Mn162]